jgi:hypothetical protein
MMSVEPNATVSGGNANNATAMLLTRKLSSPSKLSAVSSTSLATRVATLMYCHGVQDVGGETAVKLNTVNSTSAKELMIINPTEDSMMRESKFCVSKPSSVSEPIRRCVFA